MTVVLSFVYPTASLRAQPCLDDEQNPGVCGQWAGPFQLDTPGSTNEIPHIALIPTGPDAGKLILWRETQGTHGKTWIWDPNQPTLPPIQKDSGAIIFCSGQAFRPDGSLMTAGGFLSPPTCGIPDALEYDPLSQSWALLPDMLHDRYYPTCTALPDGRTLVSGGDVCVDPSGDNTLEVYDPTGTPSWTLINGPQPPTFPSTIGLYDRVHVLSDGTLFFSVNNTKYHYRLNVGTSAWTSLPDSPVFRGYGCSVLVPGFPDHVMILGGLNTFSLPSPPASPPDSEDSALWIDALSATPSWVPRASMTHKRHYPSAVVLPDGTALVLHGANKAYELTPYPHEPAQPGIYNWEAVRQPEVYDPIQDTWTPLASQISGRVYHSAAILLPDGRVVSTRGDSFPFWPTDFDNDIEIFSPPYLFKGLRPSIVSVQPAGPISYGQWFNVLGRVPAGIIQKAVLIRPGSVTHHFDMDQRYVPLTIDVPSSVLTGSFNLLVQAPTSANIAPPGYYMLFVLNDNGVPAIAKFLQLL